MGMAIFMACLLFTFSIFPTSARALAQSKNFAVATNLARERIDQERSRPYTAPAMGTIPIPIKAETEGKQADQLFDVSSTAQVINTGTNDERKDIVVTVTWTEAGITRTVRLESYVVQL